MTPILLGRWQTRLLLFSTVGLLVTLIFGRLYQAYTTPLVVLGYVLLIGFLWDILYNYVQITYRWDQDWPPLFQLVSGIVEGLFLWFVWPYLPDGNLELTLNHFIIHYSAVWIVIFLSTQGPLRIIFPRWRYYGGRWF